MRIFPLRHIGRDDRGAAAVELALLMPLLALVLAGMVDLARAVWQHQIAVKAARDSVRFLTRMPDPWDSPSTEAQAVNLARTGTLAGGTATLATGISASFSYPVAAAVGLEGSDRMVVGVVTITFEPLTGFAFVPTLSLTAAHAERYIGE